jgi:hypothetical protein
MTRDAFWPLSRAQVLHPTAELVVPKPAVQSLRLCIGIDIAQQPACAGPTLRGGTRGDEFWAHSNIARGTTKMANVNATTAQVVGRARTVISQTKRKGEALATELAKKPAVKQARKKVARVRGQAVALAGRVTDKISDKITGRARRRKRARVAAAVVGAAAVATAAGISMARKRKR